MRLLNDPNELLQHSAIEALGASTDPDSEARLLALLPNVDESEQGWITTYLARRQSAQFLPLLLQEIANLDLTQPKAERNFRDFTRIETLGDYTDPRAKALLWQLVDRYRWDSRFHENVYGALLRQLEATHLPRLLERLVQLKKVNEHEQASAWQAIAAAVGLQHMFGQVSEEDEFAEFMAESEAWWGLAPFTPELRQSLSEHYHQADLYEIVLTAFQAEVAARNDQVDEWLAEWQAGTAPVGYRRRTLAGWQILSTCARLTFPADIPHHALAARDLGILILGQYLLDEDDETPHTMHTIGLLHGLNNEEMDAWAAVVQADVAVREQSAFDFSNIQSGLDFTMAQPLLTPATAQDKREEAARKARKKKRDQAKATKKVQQKAKKKKR